MYCSWDGIKHVTDETAALRQGDDVWVSLLLGAEHAEEAPKLVDALNQRGIPFFGAIFPGLINGDAWAARGALLNRWRLAAHPRLAALDDGKIEWDQPLPSLERASVKRPTVVVLVDFWSRQVTKLLDESIRDPAPAVAQREC